MQPHRHRRGIGRRFLWFLVTLVASLAAYFLIVYPWISRWGASAQEVTATLPGDELVPHAVMVTTKAVTIGEGADEVWPWLLQLGVDRGGMYSYLWVENWLLRLDVENSDEIRPQWQNLQVGDFIRFTPKEYRLNPGPGLWVVLLEPERALVGCFGLENLPVNCSQSSTWQFVLEPQEENSTRLILRSRTAGTPSLMASFGARLGYAFQFYMEQKMLNVIQERAETFAVR
jgi:hypothetical protein